MLRIRKAQIILRKIYERNGAKNFKSVAWLAGSKINSKLKRYYCRSHKIFDAWPTFCVINIIAVTTISV